MSTLKSTILRITRRTKKGFTVGEIYDRLTFKHGYGLTPYSSVRARVYEMANAGLLHTAGVRRDPASNRVSYVFKR